jgi:hypothetical protein
MVIGFPLVHIISISCGEACLIGSLSVKMLISLLRSHGNRILNDMLYGANILPFQDPSLRPILLQAILQAICWRIVTCIQQDRMQLFTNTKCKYITDILYSRSLFFSHTDVIIMNTGLTELERCLSIVFSMSKQIINLKEFK